MSTTDLSPTLSDRDLVARARDGDVIALNLLLTAVRVAVHRYTHARLRTYSGGTEVAEDVTQEVCLAVVGVLPRYHDTGAPFAALVYRIAANKVADAQRGYARSPTHVGDELPDLAELAPDPEQQSMARSDVDVALDLLARLPERTARVVRLRAEGFSADEVGTIVGLTGNAVRVTQHRALTRVRKLVADSADLRERFANRRAGPVAA